MSSKGGDNSSVPAKAKPAEIEAFLRQVALAPKPVAGKGEGRLVFAMDATASRRPTWDEAQQVQSEMFRAVEGVGGLSVQLVFFRGMGECRASGWVKASRDLERLMRRGMRRRPYPDRARAAPHLGRNAREACERPGLCRRLP